MFFCDIYLLLKESLELLGGISFAENDYIVVRHNMCITVYDTSSSVAYDATDIDVVGQTKISHDVSGNLRSFASNKLYYFGIYSVRMLSTSRLSVI